MTQYDAGPGDWSDREWEEPDRKRKPHATRRRLVLPPWALLAIIVGVVIILCVLLTLGISGALGGKDDSEARAPVATSTSEPPPTNTPSLLTAILLPPPAATEPPGDSPTAPTLTDVAPGALVMVKGTKGAGLRIRENPSTQARIVTTAKEGAELTVLEGPEQGGGYTWWKLRTPDGKEGWGAGEWLVLKSE